ncbi:MAG TPA: hypothetical protein PLC04_06250 [Candidatus Kapabacteria bacterium]|jgi:hypothetical protein|nr:hypothetical protein [Candidatus Kapabacteria bacterium]
MKTNIIKNLSLIIVTSIMSIVILISCDTNKSDKTMSVNPQLTAVGPVWRDCPNESWDGNLNSSCQPPENNCVVVCGEKLPPNIGFEVYDFHVSNGTIADYYASGEGQNFLPLREDVLQELISNQVTIVRVPSSSGVYYAIVDVQ